MKDEISEIDILYLAKVVSDGADHKRDFRLHTQPAPCPRLQHHGPDDRRAALHAAAWGGTPRARYGRTAAVFAACILLGAAPALAQVPGDSHASSEDSIARPSIDSALQAAAWLAGCWQAESPDGRNAAEEQWMAPRGGLMVGMSRSVREGEARGHELLTIRVAANRLVYHAVPSGQIPTDFPARRVEKDRLEFVNSEHDFPQKIVYTRRGENAVEAAVFGGADGTEPAFVIPYERERCPGS